MPQAKKHKSTTKTSQTRKAKSVTSSKTTKITAPKHDSLTSWGKVWRIALAILVPLGGGIVISLFTRNTMEKFGAFNQPPLAPPAWLFPVAWTLLYTMMGLASYFIWKKGSDSKNPADRHASKVALILYGTQLTFNFIWTPLFFTFDLFWVALGWLAIMWGIILALMIRTYKISRPAFWMLLPYLLWCTFATYLNCGIAILN